MALSPDLGVLQLLRCAFGAVALLMAGLTLNGIAWSQEIETLPEQEGTARLAVPHHRQFATFSTNHFDAGVTNGFFSQLGTNSRNCETCHRADDGWTISPQHAARLARTNPSDPLFDPFDGGSDCPGSTSEPPDARRSTLLRHRGLVREQIAIPANADFSMTSATNPQNCATPPGDPAINGKLLVYRRPLPTTNLLFLSEVRWDSRETVQPIDTGPSLANLGPLTKDVSSQANHAAQTHELSGPIDGTQTLSDVVQFELNLFTAATALGKADLTQAKGGPAFLANEVAQQFFTGQNSAGAGLIPRVFTLYEDWEPDQNGNFTRGLTPLQKSIGRGEMLFNSRTFSIANLPGLNSVSGSPLYNPEDRLADTQKIGTCSSCHNTPNVGNHSTPLQLNIGVTMSMPEDNHARAISHILDLRKLPVYALQSSNGANVSVTDPGRALISGHWTDVGKTKIPVLRGLSARAPYFHNGSARNLRMLVRYYNARFEIGFKAREIDDMVAFLLAL